MIKIDMEKPQVCGDCRFIDTTDDYPFCLVLRENRGYSFDIQKRRFPNCPLIPVEENEPTEAKKLKDLCRIMFNRCRATGSIDGAMCLFCGLKKECEEMHSV